MVVSIDFEKVNKVQPLFFKRILNKIRVRINLNMLQAVLSLIRYYPNSNSETISVTIGNQTRMPALPFSLNSALEVLANAIRQENEIIGIHIK